MRAKCLECVSKHVSSAQSLLNELMLGYPQFIHKICGELDQAAQEAMRHSFKMADELRDIRLALWEGWWKYRTGELGPDEFIEHYGPDLDTFLEHLDDAILADMLADKQADGEEDVEQPAEDE